MGEAGEGFIGRSHFPGFEKKKHNEQKRRKKHEVLPGVTGSLV